MEVLVVRSRLRIIVFILIKLLSLERVNFRVLHASDYLDKEYVKDFS